tara:strand:+ start:32306 stop:33106 length:801 start_codon:yes stop_codon:yes gene_type:complete
MIRLINSRDDFPYEDLAAISVYRIYISVLVLLSVALLSEPLFAETPDELITRGKLIFSDDFNRTEEGDTIEKLGNGWETNSEDGNRADLQDDTLVIMKGEAASHSLSVRHVNPFDDGIVKIRFQLYDKYGLKVNFNDKGADKVTWAGHVARVVVQPDSVTIQDDITGVYDLNVRKRRLSKELSSKEKDELHAFLATKQKVIKTSIELETWHELTIVNRGPKIEVYLDDNALGSFSSEGLDHQVKQNMALGVSGKVAVDDVRVWTLN